MLKRENSGLISNSLTVEQFLRNRMSINTSGMRHLEMELSLQGNITETPLDSVDAAQAESEEKLPDAGFLLKAAFQEHGGDHNGPYTFTLPVSLPETVAWSKLLARVHRGELAP